MARPKPWLKLWNEWVHDPKLIPLSLAERGAWSLLLSLAQECAADGHIVKGNGNPMTLQEIANCLHIKGEDFGAFEAMVYKMGEEGSIRQNGDGSLFVVHFQERQELVLSSTKEAVRERVREYRQRQRNVTGTPLQERESSKEKEDTDKDIYKEEEEECNDVTSLHFRYCNGKAVTGIFGAYEKNIGMLTPMITDRINDAIENYPPAWIIDAIAEAVKQNKRSWAYAEAILKRWESEGRDDNGKARQNTRGVPGNRPTGAFADLAERDKGL
jgi:DnaD/phage-associated family protein